ncbi:MAG: PEP-CTERM sorting domain-containing protein [Planctomycetota bacterium]
MTTLNHCMRYALAFVFCLAVVSTSAADVIHDENIDGDLSNDNNIPTAFMLADGSNEIIGFTTDNPLDPDYFQLTVPPGFRITELIRTEYTSGIGNRAFLAIGPGGPISGNGNGHISSMLIEENMEGTNILDDLGSQALSGTGFTGALQEGDYTFWYQELSDDTTYHFDFVVSAIPEPTSMLVVSALGLGAVVRRRRK